MTSRKWMVLVAAVVLSGVCGVSSPVGGEPEPALPEFGTVRTFSDHREIGVRFESDDAVLSGTLYLPLSGDAFPAIVLSPGSAWRERATWEEVAFVVQGAGFAVFAHDKRSFGQSTGSCCPTAETENVPLLAKDLVAATRALEGAPFVLPGRVGVLGSSHGGWVAPVAAGEPGSNIAFLVVVNGGAVSTGQENLYDELTGYSVCERSELSMDEINAKMREAGPSGFDPRPSLVALAQPAMWIYGGLDFSHPALFSKERLEEAEAAAGPKNWTILILDRANHDLVLDGAICQEEGPPVEVLTPVRAWLQQVGIVP